jgi:hypothetical protein
MLRFCCSSVGAHLDVDYIFGKVEGVWSVILRPRVIVG